MAIQRKSVAGKTVPGEKSVAGKTVPGGKRVPRGPGGKTFPKKDQPTKRQGKLAKVKDPGADGNEKGTVRGEGEFLEWEDKSGKEVTWVPAVYHNDIREGLLAKASDNGRLVYDYPRYKGFLPNDETAFLSSQQQWGADRSLWHHIPDDLLNRLDRLDYKGKDYELAYMFDEDTGRIVLDMDNHPVVDYEDIPCVLSSNFGMKEEGFILEAIRRIDQRIERSDFLARMPWERKSKEGGKVEPIFTLSSIGNRQYRWRKDNAIIAWVQRSGSKTLRDYIVSKLSSQGRTDNSTRELSNGLTKVEKMEAERPNKGLLMSKAGKRLLPDEVRREREDGLKKQSQRPQSKRALMKRKAAQCFDTDMENEHRHSSKRPREQGLRNKIEHESSQERKRPSISTSSRGKRKAPAKFDDDADDSENRKVKRTRRTANQEETHGDGPHKWPVSQSLPNTAFPASTYNSISQLHGGENPLQEPYEPQQFDLPRPGIQILSNHAYEGILHAPDYASNLHMHANTTVFNNSPMIGEGIGGISNFAVGVDVRKIHRGEGLDTTCPVPTHWNQGLIFSSGSSYPDENLNFAEPDNPLLGTTANTVNPVNLVAAAVSTHLGSSLKRGHEDYLLGAGRSGQYIPTMQDHLGLQLNLSQQNDQDTLTEASNPLAPYHGNLLPTPSQLSHEVSAFPIPLTVTPPHPGSLSHHHSQGETTFSSDRISGGSVDAMADTPNTTPAEPSTSHIESTQDYRFKQPQSIVDARHIEEALDLTRHEFVALFGNNIFGEKGPRTNYYESYAKQYAALQKEAVLLQAPGSGITSLDHWDAWGGGFDKWKGTKISKEEFLQGLKADEADADAEGEPAILDDFFEEFTTDVP